MWKTFLYPQSSIISPVESCCGWGRRSLSRIIFLLCNLNDFPLIVSPILSSIVYCVSSHSNSTVVEWTRETTKNIEMCKQQIKCAMSLRSYVEILFKQVVEDVSNRFNRTNEQFRKRMEEIRYAKMKLEGLHCTSANQVLEFIAFILI